MLRRYVAEFLGAFAIVFFGCGAIATLQQGGAAWALGVNLVFGMTVAAGIYALGHISAAHFNPAVTVGFAVAGRFPWKFVPSYIASQLLGAIAASSLHLFLIGDASRLVRFGATEPNIGLVRALATEGLLTFFLMLIVMSVATDRRVNPAIPGVAIGMFIALAGLFGGPLTGCSMNPARSLGPAVFAGGSALSFYWIYVAGPVLGASLAAVVYEMLRGGDHHSQNAPNDLFQALEEVESEA